MAPRRTVRGNVVIARVASASEPGKERVVSTDDWERLTCDCPAWTSRTHYLDCPAFRGASCTCNRRDREVGVGERAGRTCPHVRATLPEVEKAGGMAVVRRMLNAGFEVDLTGPASAAPRVVVVPAAELREVDAIGVACREFVAKWAPRLSTYAFQPALRQEVEALARRFAGKQQPAARVPLPPPDRPAWLGGGRAILIREE